MPLDSKGAFEALGEITVEGNSIFRDSRSKLMGEGCPLRESHLSNARSITIRGGQLEVASLKTGQDLLRVIPADWWTERLMSIEKSGGLPEVLKAMDGMFMLESGVYESRGFAYKKNLKETFINFSMAINNHYGSSTLEWMRKTFEERIETFTALSSKPMNNYLLELGMVGKGDVWRKMKVPEKFAFVYQATSEKIFNQSSVERTGGNALDRLKFVVENADVPNYMKSVYKEYRGGGYDKDRKGIVTFDRAVGMLMRDGGLKLHNGFQPIPDMDTIEPRVLDDLRQLAAGWGLNDGEDELVSFTREIFASVERWHMNYKKHAFTGKTFVQDYFESIVDLYDNPGVELGVGLILTEKTRSFLEDEINNVRRKKVAELHKVDGQYSQNLSSKATEKIKRLNLIHDKLRTADRFGKVSGGW